MPTFVYKALDIEGQAISGSEEAPSLAALSTTLEARQIYLTKAKIKGVSSTARYNGKISHRELISLTEQLVIIVRAGVPIIAGLEEIAAEVTHPGLKSALIDITVQVSGGSSLSAAMKSYPRIFDEAYTSVVEAGEEMGGLDTVLERLGLQMEWANDTKKAVTGALIQPAFLLVAVAGLTILIVTNLVPKLMEVFNKQGKSLPGVTVALIAVSDFIRFKWPILLATIGSLIVGFVVANRLPKSRFLIDKAKLHIPVIGRVIELFGTSQFINLFSVLYAAGVTVDRALEILRGITGNHVLDYAIDRMRASVMEGNSMTSAARETRIFPSLVVRMLGIGEQSGQVPEALRKVGIFYEKEIPRALKKILTVLNPILLFASAGIVCFVVFAAFMPLMKLISGGGH